MSYEYAWIPIALLALAGAVALAAWSRHLRESKRLALREMIHRERLVALEKGVPLPNLEAAPMEAASADGAIVWVERLALLGGLALLFTGIGQVVALNLLPATAPLGGQGLRVTAALGLMPASTGVGLLLYVWLSRRAGRSARRNRDGAA